MWVEAKIVRLATLAQTHSRDLILLTATFYLKFLQILQSTSTIAIVVGGVRSALVTGSAQRFLKHYGSSGAKVIGGCETKRSSTDLAMAPPDQISRDDSVRIVAVLMSGKQNNIRIEHNVLGVAVNALPPLCNAAPSSMIVVSRLAMLTSSTRWIDGPQQGSFMKRGSRTPLMFL